MISVQNLSFRYANEGFHLAVDSLEIDDGEKIAIVGPSGSGKSTMLNLIAGIYTPQAGEIRVDDVDVHQLKDNQRRIFRLTRLGLVFQSFELVEYLSVRDNIRLPFLISNSLNRQLLANDRIRLIAEDMGIADKLSKYPGQLSQGEQQRVAICRAVIHEPDFLLADEPTGNLDPDNKERVLDLLLEQADRSGATLIMVTHDHSLLDQFDNVIDVSEWKG